MKVYLTSVIIAGYARGALVPSSDEYIAADGLPHCKNCKTARFICGNDTKSRNYGMFGMCTCQEAAADAAEEEK